MARSLSENAFMNPAYSAARQICCPFLIDNACSIHPLRPLACRNYNVFGQQCAEGEDAYYTRRGDVLTPHQKNTDLAFDTMLPFYGAKNKAERRRIKKPEQCIKWSKSCENSIGKA